MTLELRHVTKRVRNQTLIDDVTLTFLAPFMRFENFAMGTPFES